MGKRVWLRRQDLKEVFKTVIPLAAVLGLIALGLRILNLVPPYLAQEEPMQTYATVEEAHRSTGVPVYLPAYFPDYLRWPPEEVRGWTRPQPKLSVAVVLRESGQPVLWLEEWLPLPDEPPQEVPKTAQVVERGTLALQEGVDAEVVAYRGTDTQLYYRLLWYQGGVRIMLTAALPYEELVRMVQSMHPLPSY